MNMDQVQVRDHGVDMSCVRRRKSFNVRRFEFDHRNDADDDECPGQMKGCLPVWSAKRIHQSGPNNPSSPKSSRFSDQFSLSLGAMLLLTVPFCRHISHFTIERNKDIPSPTASIIQDERVVRE